MSNGENSEKVGIHFDTYTKQTSSIGRQIALSSIAVIWLFNNKNNSLPIYFKNILLWFVIYLAADFFQYLLGSFFSHIYEGKTKYPWLVNSIINILFYVKSLILIINAIFFIIDLNRTLKFG